MDTIASGTTTGAVCASTCVVYNTSNGKILHIHQVVTYGTIKPRSKEDVGNEALRFAIEQGHDKSSLAILHVEPDVLRPRAHYRVDTREFVLVELPEELF